MTEVDLRGTKSYVGQSVKRREDTRFATGHGRYLDDVELPRQLYAAFVRSPIARGALLSVDASAAVAMDGVVAVFTAEDLHPHAHTYWVTMMGPDGHRHPHRALAEHDLRYVGEPIAVVIADSRYRAEDGAELVDIEVDAEQAVVTMAQGLEAAHLVHPELEDNISGEIPAVNNPLYDAAMVSAPRVFTETFEQHRYLCVPMECRGIIASWDAYRQHMEIVVSSQTAHETRLATARLLDVPEDHIHVVMPDVGGSFGQKMFLGREEFAIILAAKVLGRAVKWTEDRAENLIAAGHAREEILTTSFGVDDEGHLLALKAHHIENVGAFPNAGDGTVAAMAGGMFPGPYKVDHLAYTAQGVYTNTSGRCAYRGPWMMETVGREQMMDVVAEELAIDPLEIRRRNVLHQSDLPYVTASQLVYETVSPSETLEQAAQMIGYDDFRVQQEEARRDGRYLGIGLALYIEPQFGFGALGTEGVTLRVGPSGKVNAYFSSGGHGQGLETTATQVVAEHLGMDMDDISFTQGDTASTPYGMGTGGSRSAAILSGAAMAGAAKLKARIIELGSAALGASPEEVDFEGGVVMVRGDASRGLPLAHLAAMAYLNTDALPPGTETGLEVSARYKAPFVMFSNACHAVTVETDPVTGVVKILRYVVSEDCGNLINPMIVEGQIAGGVAQGIGGVFYEHFEYDADGNPLTTTFLDYHLPTAAELPDFQYGHVITPSNTPGGHKGMAEGGAMCSPPALINAVRDSLRPFGAKINTQPLTPEVLVNAIDAGLARGAQLAGQS